MSNPKPMRGLKMGAWGCGNWENDDAGDWVYKLEESTGTDVVKQTLSKITAQADYLESPDCCEALAAAEVVAALKGAPGKDLPEEVQKWVSRNKFSPELLTLAVQAVTRIKSDSELKELWEESESTSDWLKAVNDLEARLA
jgi:hypothetical protein